MKITELRAKIGEELNYGSFFSKFDGSAEAFGNLDAAQQAELTNQMLAYIRAHPSEFTAMQVEQANSMRVQGPDTSSDSVMIFLEEFGNQAQAINPLSEENRTKTAVLVCVVLVVAAIAYSYAKGGGSITINKGAA